MPMNLEGERLSRAGNYVLGLMTAAERERAERDLEIDPEFREAVVSIAERMRVLDFAPEKQPPQGRPVPRERWQAIAARIGDMPQMRGFGEMPVPRRRLLPRGLRRVLLRLPPRRVMLAAAALVAAYLLGYLTALWRF